MSDLLRLAKPFAPHLVQKPPAGKHGDYVSHSSVVEKLLAVVGPFDWTVGPMIRSSEGQVVGCYGTLTVTIDGRPTSVTEVGCFDGADRENDGDRAKKASSDAFKRAAMRLGVGLHLWSQQDFFLFDFLSKAEEASPPLPLDQPKAAEPVTRPAANSPIAGLRDDLAKAGGQ